MGTEAITLGPQLEDVLLTKLNVSIYWDGDKFGTGLVMLPEGQTIEFTLKKIEETFELDIPVHIAPLEKGESTTPTSWHMKLERF